MEELWSQYYKRAVALYESGELGPALKIAQECLKISIKTYGKKSKEYFRTLYLMGNIFKKSGKYYEALSAFNEVKSIYQSSGGYDIKQDVLLKIENNIKELEGEIEESRLSENLDEKEEQGDIQPNSEGEESDEQKRIIVWRGRKNQK